MATRTIADGGGNYNSTGTWVEGAVPTNADDVVATATSGDLTVTATAAAKTLVLTGYVGILTINSGYTLTVSGTVTLASGMTFAGTGTLSIITSATLTANGKTVSGNLTLTSASTTFTLADDWAVDGTLTTGTYNAVTINGSGRTLTVNGSWTQSGRTAGTATIQLGGTGTWTGNTTTTYYCSNPVTINTAGTITLAATGPNFGANTVTYTAGTLVSTGSTIYINGNVTLSGAFPTLNKFYIGSASILTIDNDMTVTDITANNNLTVSGSFDVTVSTLTANTSLTLTRALSWTITTLNISSGALTLAGAFDQTIANLVLYTLTSLKLPDSQTLTISTSLICNGVSYNENFQTISSTTPSTSSTITYNGTQANMNIVRYNFTDIVATNTLWNYCGRTLTRCTGIVNTSYTPGDYSDPGEANVLTGTSYLYQGATMDGTASGGDGGGLLTHPGMVGGARG